MRKVYIQVIAQRLAHRWRCNREVSLQRSHRKKVVGVQGVVKSRSKGLSGTMAVTNAPRVVVLLHRDTCAR